MEAQHMITIGIVENSRERTTFKFLKEIFAIFNYELCYENKTRSIAVLNKKNNIIFISDIKSNLISPITEIGIDFNILIHTFLNPNDYKNKNLQKLFSRSEYAIINSDEEKWNYLFNDNIKPIVITYGFNNKATINPSSYNIDDLIELNICFQREIKIMNGTMIEPFELPIKIHSGEKLDIYPVISAITCVLLLGIDKFSMDNLIVSNINIVKGKKEQ